MFEFVIKFAKLLFNFITNNLIFGYKLISSRNEDEMTKIIEKLKKFGPKLFTKEYNLELDEKELAAKVDQFLNKLNTKYSSVKAMAKFYEIYPKQYYDLDKMFALLITTIYINHLDDCVEESKENCLRWLDLLDEKIEPNDSALEVHYTTFVKPFFATLTEFHRYRNIKCLKDFVNCGIKEHDEKDALLNMNKEDYVIFRCDNNLCGFQVFELEYGMDMNINEEIFNSPLMTRMWANFNAYVSICQDLYSVKKEMSQKGAQANYLYYIMRDNKCSLEAAVDESMRILDNMELDIDSDLTQILASDYGLGPEFRTIIGNFMHGTIDFYLIAPRYNS